MEYGSVHLEFSRVARPIFIVCLAICGLFGCGPRKIKDWSGDAIVFRNVRVITTDGQDFTKFCERGDTATDDYVPGKTYSRHRLDLDHDVYISRVDNDGSYFTAAAPNEPVHLYLNCTQVLARSLTRETDYQLHVDIGTFIAPDKRAASYFGYLIVHLESDGMVTTGLATDDATRLAKVPLPVAELHLPLIRISLSSIVKSAGWNSSKLSHMNVIFP